MRRLLSATATASLLLAQTPVLAEGNADDIGVMSVSLKETIKPRFGFQGQTQGAGTPNQAGIGGFIPLFAGDNSVFFADVQANANFEDFNYYSSIVTTTVSGTTISTSSRLGYRWLNSSRSWMYGVNAGYDTRPMATGNADTGYVHVTDKNTVFFQQAAFNAEAISDRWTFRAYGLFPTGDIEEKLNSTYSGGSLCTAGGDFGYHLTPSTTVLAGYYYQDGDDGSVDGSGVKTALIFTPNDIVQLSANYSFDPAFESRASLGITIRLGINKTRKRSNEVAKPQIKGLTATPVNRDIRVHDCCWG